MTEPVQQPLAIRHFNQGLFADHYLDNIVPDRWARDTALFADAKACQETLRALRAQIEPENLDEAQLEERYIQPVLKALGHHYAVQVKVRYMDTGHRKPDYVFTATADEARALTSAVYTSDELRHLLAVGDAKRWGARLDQSAQGQRSPAAQINEYLYHSERPWGILTDGRIWRLYHRDKAKDNKYYAVDLDSLLAADTEQFQYFYAFFRREAFTGRWLEDVLRGSEEFARQLSDNLEDQVFEALEGIAQGFLDYRRNQLDSSPATLRTIYEQSLVLLYRLLFIFYAESRGILPMDNESYRERLSISAIRTSIANDLRFGRFADADSGTYYNRLRDLFFAIDQGNPAYDVPPYNGRLFNDAEHSFLADKVVGDAYLVPALDRLGRIRDPEQKQRVNVDYRDLDVRHLGSIYEKLLEYELDIAAEPLTIKGKQERYAPAEPGDPVIKEMGQVFLRTGSSERKVTGSYYTPDYIVRFIVEKTLEPLLTHITEQHATRDDEGQWQVHDPEALTAAILSLNVLDPATGSGHFAVDAAAYIAEWLRDLALNPPGLGDEDELIYWKRQVASACIYAVDINPLAVELAKLSMWLATLARGKPLSFLDHHIRLGNSLVGTSIFDIDDDLEAEKKRKRRKKIEEKKAAEGQQPMFTEADFNAGVRFAVAQMSAIESTSPRTVADVKEQERLYHDLTRRLQSWKQAADVWTARSFGLELSADQWKQIRIFTRSEMVPASVQTLVDEAARIAREQRFFHWELAFPEVFFRADGQPKENPGFDAVIGNPPYVRQESITPIKTYLQLAYDEVYSGTADIYAYFYARGLEKLRQDGLLSYITPNKWFSAEYGEGLRGYLAENSHIRQIVDFGHAPIFKGVDTFPMIGVFSRSDNGAKNGETEICDFPRDELKIMLKQAGETGSVDLKRYISEHSFNVPSKRYSSSQWSLEPPAVDRLMEKLSIIGLPLQTFAGSSPVYGIKTGFNEAFLIDSGTRDALISADPKCAEIIRPYLRGQDVKRWIPEWDEQWMILLKSSENHDWPWHDAGEDAEKVFEQTYPSLYSHMYQHDNKLKRRKNQGRYWWELNSLTSFDLYETPKIIYQEIQFHPQYSYDTDGYFTNNKCFFLPIHDLYVLAVLNSPLMWWHNWRYLTHMKDEALTPSGVKMVNLPIATPSEETRAEVESRVQRQLDLTRNKQETMRDVLDWLRLEFGVDKPGNKLQDFATLDEGDFIKEVRKRGSDRLTPAALRHLREQFTDYSRTIGAIETERLDIEHRLSDLVNQAYGLTPEEIDLMWRTAPPRMPIQRRDS